MKIILYHGIDHDLFEKISDAAKGFPHCEAIQRAPDKGNLIQQVFKLRPHIVIVDVAFANYLSEEIRQLKRLSDFKSTLFVGFCKDEQEAKAGELFLISGTHLLHMNDTDFDSFFRDCFQIAFEARNTISDFARARNLEIPVKLGFLSTFTSLDPESFLIETDLQLSDEVALRFPMAPNEPTLLAKITENFEGSVTAPFFYGYRMNFPFPGPWDEVSENTLSRETVETWIELKGKYLDRRKDTLAIFTKNDAFTEKLLLSEGASWYQIYRSVHEAHSTLFNLKPGVIFFDLHADEGTDLKALGEVIEILRNEPSATMVIVLGSKSDSAELRRLYNYEYLISYPGMPDHLLFLALEKKFLEKAKSQKKQYYLSPTDHDRIILVMKEAILTSISERDITFILDGEIPYFSVIKSELPITMYLTIIPAEGQLPTSNKGTHYRALIHGLSEENLTKIRKIVNQLIYTPVKELSHTIVETMLKQDYVQKEKQAETVNTAKIITDKSSDKADRFEIKRNCRGNSKL